MALSAIGLNIGQTFGNGAVKIDRVLVSAPVTDITAPIADAAATDTAINTAQTAMGTTSTDIGTVNTDVTPVQTALTTAAGHAGIGFNSTTDIAAIQSAFDTLKTAITALGTIISTLATDITAVDTANDLTITDLAAVDPVAAELADAVLLYDPAKLVTQNQTVATLRALTAALAQVGR